MRTRLNILTGLILFVFTLSVINSLMAGFENAQRGLEKSREQRQITKSDWTETHFRIAFDKPLVVDSIYNQSSFLSAEILAFGLRLKEEQDLTI